MKELTVNRMIELENMVQNHRIEYPLDIKEWRYVDRASKMCYEDVMKQIDYFERTILPIENVRHINDLMEKYKCTFDELNKRLEDVCMIKEYKNMVNNNLLKEQKRMIKRIKHSR